MGFPDCPPLNLEMVSCSTKKIFLHSSGFTREEKRCRGEQREGIESKKVWRRTELSKGAQRGSFLQLSMPPPLLLQSK